MRSISFGVAHRVTAGLIAITMLTIFAAALAFYGVGQFRDGFDRIAVKRLTDLITVSKLVQQSEAIAVTAPRLVTVTDRFEHVRAMRHVNDLFRLLDSILETLSASGFEDAALKGMAQHRSLMTENLDKLNRIVADRLIADRQAQESIARIEALSRKTHQLENLLLAPDQALKRQDGGEPLAATSFEESNAMRHWAAANNEGINIMTMALIAPNQIEVRRLATEFHNACDQANAEIARLPPASAERLGGMLQEAAILAEGENGIFAARRHQLSLAQEMQGALHQTNVLTGQFIAAVSNLFADVQSGIEAERYRFGDLLSNGSRILLGIISISILASVLIFLYLRRQVISRLVQLRNAMLGHAAGRAVAISTEGTDELADMARALEFFVTEIQRRQNDLRSAKDAAETAYQDLKTAQQQLVQVEKLAALGGLVAGVAHEINTPIGVALTAASYMADEAVDVARRYQEGQLRRSDLERHLANVTENSQRIQSNMDRAATLIQSFKQVAADQSSEERRSFDLKRYIGEIVFSLGPRLRSTRHQITIECPDQVTVDTYPGAFAQVLTNLIFNALTHAFADRDEGRIEILVRIADADRVELCFTDNGCGIPKQNLGRIFDPFFTTRRGSGGTGLGLHIVHNIVTQTLCGEIRVASQLGHGTEFRIRFPRSLPPEISAPLALDDER